MDMNVGALKAVKILNTCF